MTLYTITVFQDERKLPLKHMYYYVAYILIVFKFDSRHQQHNLKR